jgi:hypothetical protein
LFVIKHGAGIESMPVNVSRSCSQGIYFFIFLFSVLLQTDEIIPSHPPLLYKNYCKWVIVEAKAISLYLHGDKLYATYTGISGANVTFSGEYIFTGGTGKFKGASGSAKFLGTVSLATNKGEFSLRGKIKLKKHDRDDDD